MQIAGPFSASAVGDSFGKCGKGRPLPVDETAHIGSVSLNSIGRRAIFCENAQKRIFSLIIVKIFTKSNSKYLYYANILKKNVGERNAVLYATPAKPAGRP